MLRCAQHTPRVCRGSSPGFSVREHIISFHEPRKPLRLAKVPGKQFSFLPGKEIDELLGSASRGASAAELPLVRLLEEFLLREGDLRIPLRQLPDDMQILPVRGFHVTDGNAEAGHQGELLLHGIGPVQLVVGSVGPVRPGLADQMAAVGCRVDQDIFRFCLKAALNDGNVLAISDVVSQVCGDAYENVRISSASEQS